jgi:hypothetical protein
MPVIIDSNSESGQNTATGLSAGNIISLGQSFNVSGNFTLYSCKFYLRKFGSPTGNITASIYAITGSFGSNSKPTGSALAVSDNISISGLTTSFQLINFNFSGVNRITLNNATNYVVVVNSNLGDSSNFLQVGSVTPGTHPGNYCFSTDDVSWTGLTGLDLCFYVYGIQIFNPAFSDLSSSANISDYKWLSKTLKTAQQQQAVRPFYQCKIIDDSVVGDAVTTPGNPTQGSSCVGPDGFMYAAGMEAALGNNIALWKGTAPSSLIGTYFQFIAFSSASNNSPLNHISIRASDWINGTFKLDVYFFSNFDNSEGGGYLNIKHYYSLDRGSTWHSDQAVNQTQIPYNATTNIWLAAGKAYQDDSNNIISTVFYVTPIGSYYGIAYQQYLGSGGTYQTQAQWSVVNINTKDWNIHSLDVEYIDGYWYVVFSGFHSFYEPTNQVSININNNIYITKILNLVNDGTKDIWTSPQQIISALSTSPLNQNNFTYPSLFYDGIYLWTFFRGVVVTSVVQNTTATTVNYFLGKSADFKNFSYPVPAIFGGALFNDTAYYSLFLQLGKYWVVGGGQAADYSINSIVADVSNDIISYECMDTSDNPSTINIDIGNQNGQWRGSSPTNPGYQAIASNKKIALFQGYYNSDGVPEVAPKNTYYIDDIHQNVAANRNDFSLLGRDWHKNLTVLTTQFAYNYTGIKKYIDTFEGTTLGNYVLDPVGTWSETGNILEQTNITISSYAIFSLYQQDKANTIFTVSAQLPSPSTNAGNVIYIYFYYIDQNNWMRLAVSANGSGTTYAYKIQKNFAGSTTDITTSTFNVIGAGSGMYPFMFVRHGYTTFDIYVGIDANNGQDISAFSSAQVLTTNLDLYYGATFFTSIGTVGFGALNFLCSFRNFKYTEFDISVNLSELLQTIGTISGIFQYKMPTVFQDYFFSTANYNGTFTSPNRVLTLGQNQTVMKTDIQISDGEVEFKAAVTPTSGTLFYFDFIFRNTGTSVQNENYFFRIVQNDGAGTTAISLYTTHSGSPYELGPTIIHLHFDFKKYHSFRAFFFEGYIFLAIDGIVVYAWYDNNLVAVQTIGYIGFRTYSNTQLQVKQVLQNSLYTQISSFAINPGDDLQNSMQNLLDTIRCFFFSDLMGRFKVLILNSSDPAFYTYQNQLVSQQVDNSDKEYVNQVTVIGTNVQATAQDVSSINSNSIVRQEVITDFAITTYTDALARANLELINFKKYLNQYTPAQILNVGSELYDVVLVVNTGSNTSNINQNVRVYSQDMQVGGNKLNYWMTVQTGLL